MLSYRILFSVFLIFLSNVIYGLQPPPKHPVYQDSTISFYEKRIVHFRYNNPDSAVYYAKKGLKVATRHHDDEGIARMYTQMGMIDDNSGKADLSRPKYLKALEIYERLNISRGVIKINIRLGVIANRDGNYDHAARYLLTALKLSEKTRDKAGIMETYVYLGESYSYQHKDKIAFDYFKKAEVISKELPFFSTKLNLYAALGAAYRAMGNVPVSISYYELGISQSDTPEMMGLNISLNTGLAQVYAQTGALDKAISLQKGALVKARRIKNVIREFVILRALADSYETIDPAVSLSYLQQALSLALDKKANKQVIEVLDKIALLNEKQHNFKEAYQARSRQYNLADSFYFKDISVRISDLQAEYELNKSQANVQQLKFINNKQVLEQNILRWIIAGSSVMLLILAAYFFKIRKLNRLLNKSNTALIESNTVKDKLFSVLAHDLRAPLASVINLMDMINRDWLTEEEKDLMMSKLLVHCNASMETLNLLLRWGQMQLKGIMINQTKMLPLKTINRNISLLQESAHQKSINIGKEVPQDLCVFCDADHLDFLIRNLLSNAIKFTPDGGKITISVENYLDNQVLFRIKDNGVGVEKERLDSIFNISSESTNGTKNEKGTSLGLFICKEFISANEGKIWAESKVGEGSEFYFTLKGC